jgi:para-aminobenzoate synthetase / 4-amino-4-deoxychorismate lyase
MKMKVSEEPMWDDLLPSFAGRDDILFLETRLTSDGEHLNYLFLNPTDEIIVRTPEETPDAFDRMERAVRDGLYAAGFFSYELGYCLDEGVFEPPAPQSFPLLHIGLYSDPAVFDTAAGKWVSSRPPENICYTGKAAQPIFSISEPVVNETINSYEQKIAEIKRLIERGDTYQINYTVRLNFGFAGNPLGLYLYLREKQKTAYSAFWRAGPRSILSFSPELFFRIADGAIEARPMKGTIGRGVDAEEDLSLAEFLRNDEKNRAENVMIVDLLRNDLGRTAAPRSVSTTRLFNIERYETLHQMTSTVTARLDPGTSPRGLLASLFPCGSVTGAPKISSMKIIRELERGPRGIYTGAIGFIGPAMRRAAFNVSIRTVRIDGGQGELGIGGAIVYDSGAREEWNEALLKGKFFISSFSDVKPSDFSIIETMFWQPEEGFSLIDLHLDRLMRSARRFGFTCDTDAIRDRLDDAVKNDSAPARVRLLLSPRGEISVAANVFIPGPADMSLRCAFSSYSVISTNPFLQHKTTLRTFYDSQHAEFARRGFFDVIFTNERGEVTEGTITNVLAKFGNELFTPPLECGLLPGVYRRYLLEAGIVREKTLYPSDLDAAEEILLCNSVRGAVKVTLE